MFFHQFCYIFKILFKNKSLIFWTFAFPIIMSLLFNFAFSDIENNEKLDVFDIAIVNNEDFKKNEMFTSAFEELGDSHNDSQLFNIEYVDEDKAKNLLDDSDICGYLLLENENKKIVTKTSGIHETIFKYVVDELSENEKMIASITELEIKNGTTNPSKIASEVKRILEGDESYTKDKSRENLSYMMIEFYTLIAMICLYGGIIVMEAMNLILANMSNKGKRVSIAPVRKSKLILSSILASLIIEIIGVYLLLSFCYFVLNVNFGDNLLYILLLSFVGTIAGLALGLFVSVVSKTNENTKVGIIIAVSMALCILSGMTGVTLKYIVDSNTIVNKFNPANMITDGFYSLYYYDTLTRYYTNLIGLIIFAAILIIISSLILRRQKYDSV